MVKPTPIHMKYPKYDSSGPSESQKRMAPSAMLQELLNGPGMSGRRPVPRTVEFQNMGDHTSHVSSAVPLDEPLFQPFPLEVLFQDYEPFGTYEQKLYLRNNDAVARRVKIKPPDSPYFEISGARSAQKNQPLTDGKIAAGMEVCFVVKFKPQERRNYEVDLLVSTEREKFIVPVKALGTRAVLNLPDDVVFTPSPVKAPTRRTLMVRNLGSQSSNVVLSCTPPFSVQPSTAHVGVGSSLQLDVIFQPPHATTYTGELTVLYEDGTQACVRLSGSAENVDVQLGQPTVQLDPAYISLSSRKMVRVFNRSDAPVSFAWKAFAQQREEELERLRLKTELDSMEALELQTLEATVFAEDSDPSLSEEDDGNHGVSGGGLVMAPEPSAKRLSLAMLRRKYKNLRRAVDEDLMLFADANFRMEPAIGEIWANSEVEISITFLPQTAADYVCTAFLDVTGRESRLPLLFTGKGIGPRASLSYDVLDIGDVFVGSFHRYDLGLTNRGDIECRYELLPLRSLFGSKFNFNPSRGILAVGETHSLEVSFSSESLGEFSELFSFKLYGSDEPLSVLFKGHVIGPTFNFDVEEIDFGRISFSFLQSKVVTLHNTSEVPMRFSLRIPDDGPLLLKEFDIVPSSGSILPGAKQRVQIDLISTTVKKYCTFLSVDVDGVGDGVFSLPIRAESEVPVVIAGSDELSYGDCFLSYPYVRKLRLVNQSRDLQAKYEVLVQDEYTQAVAVYTAAPVKAAIPPQSEVLVDIKLVCEKLGAIRLPMYVKIGGSSKPPLQVLINATCGGPQMRSDKEEINWGPVPCLIEHDRTLVLTNDSLIPAPFRIFVKNPRSKFRVNASDGVLAPGEVVTLTLTAKLDDTVSFADQLHVFVSEGKNLVIPLLAKGTATTIWCAHDLSLIDYGFQFTSRDCERRLTLENRGRRTQVLTWIYRTVLDREADQRRGKKKVDSASAGAAVGAAGINGALTKEKSLKPVAQVFSVYPESIELKPFTACTFSFKGNSSKRGLASEVMILESRVGAEKLAKPIFNTEVKCDFISPILEPSFPSLNFNYTFMKDVPITFQSQPMTLRNGCELPLTFVLRTQVPFSVDTWECTLAPADSLTLNVEFDPGYLDDRQSRTINSKLVAVYRDHPQKDNFDLNGEICFPNLEFEFNQVDFGAILNDTSKSIVVRVVNCSKVDTVFQWAFPQDDDESRSISSTRRPHIPLNQVFDVLPIRSYLKPGEVENVEFIFYGHANRQFRGSVVAEVEGGPHYEIELKGEASNVGYKVDRTSLDFGQLQHDRSEEKEFFLINTSRVAYPFTIRLDRISRPGVVSVSPSTGRVLPNDKQRILVRFKPGLPERISEIIMLELGHFEPMEFFIYGEGIYASVVVSLPRGEQPPLLFGSLLTTLPGESASNISWPELVSLATRNLDKNSEKAADPSQASVLKSTALSRPPSASITALRSAESPPAPVKATVTKASSSRADAVARFQQQLRLESEANRIFYIQHLQLEEKALGAVKLPMDNTPVGVIQPPILAGIGEDDVEGGDNDDGIVRPTVPPLPLSASFGEVTRIAPPTPPSVSRGAGSTRRVKTEARFTIARYVCDFGHVILDTHRKKTFKVVNTSSQPVSFTLDKALALLRGFLIEPERVVRLPEGQSVDFTVTFTAKQSAPLGPVRCEIPLDLKNGPITEIVFMANVTVPDLKLSRDSLEFGDIVVSRSRVIYVQLENPTPVLAEWAIKRGLGPQGDVANFVMTPSQGSLAPGERSNVAIEFIPNGGKMFATAFPLKIASNTKLKTITCRGSGSELAISFNPPSANLGPVLPYAELTEATIEIRNNSDCAIEVFSVDFDSQYLEEERLLGLSSRYSLVDEMLRLPVRLPGAPLASSVIEEEAARERARVSLAQQQEADAEALVEWERRAVERQAAGENFDVEFERSAFVIERAAARDAEALRLASESQNRSRRQKGTQYDQIFDGPPLCGVTSQAYRLASRFGYGVLRLDELVERGLNDGGDLGRDVRRALNRLNDEEKAAKLAELVAQAAAKLGGKKPVKGKEDPPPELDLTPVPIDQSLLERLLKWVLDSPEFGNGVIIDRLECGFAESLSIVRNAVAAVLVSAKVVLFSIERDAYASWLSDLKQKAELVFNGAPTEMLASAGGISASLEQPRVDDSTDQAVVGSDVIIPFEELDESRLAVLDDGAREAYELRKTEHIAALKSKELAIEHAKSLELARKTLVRLPAVEDLQLYDQWQSSLADLVSLFSLAAPSSSSIDPANAGENPAGGAGVQLVGGGGALSDLVDRVVVDDDSVVSNDLAAAVESNISPSSTIVSVPVGSGISEEEIAQVVVSSIPNPTDEERVVLQLPPPVTYQLVRRPISRVQRPPSRYFSICRIPTEEETKAAAIAAAAAAAASEAAAAAAAAEAEVEAKKSKGPASKAGKKVEESIVPLPPLPVDAVAEMLPITMRWVIPPRSSVPFLVKFASTDAGRFDAILRFEIVGLSRSYSLPCSGLAAVPSINSEPRNVFMNRVKSRPPHMHLAKKYITSSGIFEFGPLLIGKGPECMASGSDGHVSARKTNAESFRITNNSPLKARVNFTFLKNGPTEIGQLIDLRGSTPAVSIPEDSKIATKDSKKKESKDKGSEPSVIVDSSPVFFVVPAFLELSEGQTDEVTVWHFPRDSRLYEDSLVCCIENNPIPVCFPISGLGEKPKLQINGPWDAALEVLASEVNMAKEGSPERAASEAQLSALRNSPPAIDFDRLLLQRSEEREFKLSNISTIPVAWRLDLSTIADALDFSVNPQHGLLPPGGEAFVTVRFTAGREAVYSREIRILYSDIEGGMERPAAVTVVPITLKAEGYHINIVSFEAPLDGRDLSLYCTNGVLNYDVQRVGDYAVRLFMLTNAGKYDVKFSCVGRRALARSLFTIEPAEGVIPSNGSQVVMVTFCSDREVRLKDNKDIRCTLMEARSSEVYQHFDITVNVRSVFSKFRLQPLRGLNFGAMIYNEAPRSRKLELRNEGEFPFTFIIGEPDSALSLLNTFIRPPMKPDFSSLVVAASTAAAAPAGKDAKKSSAPPAPAVSAGKKGAPLAAAPSADASVADINALIAPFRVGRFTIEPQGGVIQPGALVSVDIKFAPNGAAVYRENVRLEISGRDFSDVSSSNILDYELVGESCYPGINTSNFEAIFEEQTVVRTLTLLDAQKNVFAETEKRFSFGPVVPTAHAKGVVEKFKISNSNKVRAQVNFRIRSVVETPASNELAKVFAVQPSSWDIPSHEHRYVSVYFSPSAMQAYNGVFVAEVEGGADPTTNKLEFEIMGLGTLPCLTVEKPSKVTPEGAMLLEFGRCQVGKNRRLPVVIRNNGIVPAVCSFLVDRIPSFSFTNRGGPITFESKQVETFYATFKPTEPGLLRCNVRLQVRNNLYEETVVTMLGEGYAEDITLEDMPNGAEDEVVFEEQDLALADPKQVRFSVKNHTAGPMRFEWANHSDFKFVPSVGHLLPNASKSIIATFSSDVPTAHNQIPVMLNFSRIRFTDAAERRDWDDTIKVVRYATQEELDAEAEAKRVALTPVSGKKGSEKKGEKKEEKKEEPKSTVPRGAPGVPIRVIETAQEPEFTPDGNLKSLVLKCTAAADKLSYSCDVSNVNFRATTMFQTRMHKFSVRNTSRTQMSFSWGFEDMGGAFGRRGSTLPCPFSIEPSSGLILAQASREFVVRFSPTEVDDFFYQLACSMTSLPSDSDPLVLEVRGRAVRPVCHFDVQGSDYATRRPTNLPGPAGQIEPLDPNVRVIEFESLGTRVRNTQRFYILNPMNASYEYFWEPLGVSNPSFRCINLRGLMLAGKRSEIVFEFTPDTVSVQEAFYKFSIPSHDISELFLLTGHVVEPKVALNKTKVDFSQLLLGAQASETVEIVNSEHIPFSFSFDRSSFDFPGSGEGGRSVISVSPSSGTVPPNGTLAVELVFRPTEEKEYNFNLVCLIRKKPTKLSLNVKGEGYAVRDRLVLEDRTPSGDITSLDLSAGTGALLDFGTVHINEKVLKNVTLYNSGRVTFDYNWSRCKNPMLAIMPEAGRVGKGERKTCQIEFNPVSETSLDQLQIVCTIAGTRRYPITLSGRGIRPALNLSFYEHDFGPCFVSTPGSDVSAEEILLRISNGETERDLSFDCLYEKTNYLEIKCSATVLSPGEVVDVPIVFTARELRSYDETIPFLVNGTSHINVVIKAEGCVSRVELSHPGQANLNFGSVPAGGEATKVVKLVNRSKRAVKFDLIEHDGAGRGRLEEVGIAFFPSREIRLRARESVNVELKFSPSQRVPLFEEELMIRHEGGTKRLLTIQGQSQGLELRLESDGMTFGAVCERSRVTRRLQLQNTGDVIAKYRWDVAAFSPDFSISPSEGFVAPYSDVKFDVTFHPVREEEDIRYEQLRCYVEGREPLHVTLTGSCVRQPDDAISKLMFEARVRETTRQTVSVKNPTKEIWRIVPVLSGDHWVVAEEAIDIPPNGSGTLTIVYQPLAMTKGAPLPQPPTDAKDKAAQASYERALALAAANEDGLHTGSLFLALPDGTALLYPLVGRATAPNSAGNIELSTPAKKPLAVMMNLQNWLKIPQRFSVSTDLEKSESTFVDGASTVDVPGGGARDYKLRFFAYKEGITRGRVTFRNESTGEFIFYSFAVTASEPGVAEEITMDAPIRQVVRHVVTIENPLPPTSPVTFPSSFWQCNDSAVRVVPLGEMTGKREGAFEIQYRPLVPESSVTRTLTIRCNELGVYNYRLKLSSSRPSTDRNLSFSAPLGGSQLQVFRFRSFMATAADFSCRVSSPTFFSVPPVVRADPSPSWEGVDVSVQVVYEPEAVGDVRDTLVVRHADGGEYLCVLQGTCTPPLPQGPFNIPRNGSIDIPLKNVFNEPREFTVSVDNPQFQIVVRTLAVPQKQTKNITVKFIPTSSLPSAVSGKILVSCPALRDLPPWVFYLSGDSAPPAGAAVEETAPAKKIGKK